MKLPVLATAAATLLLPSAVQAGGAPPFTNLSPLQSGIDGSYQATARGENLTGVIRFAYQGQVQSPISSANTYVFFIDGKVARGSVTASITGKQLAGVLGGESFSIPTDEEGNVELPTVFIVSSNRANGNFSGNIDLNDRMSYFSGEGLVTAAPEEEVTFVGIGETQGDENTTGGIVIIDSDSIVIPESEIVETEFTFEGVRTTTIAQGSFQSTAGSSANSTTTGQ